MRGVLGGRTRKGRWIPTRDLVLRGRGELVVHGSRRLNGIEVAPLIAREMDRRYPERRELFSDTPQGMQKAWSTIEEMWARTTERAMRLPEAKLQERVDEEWSFLETLRHLVFTIDSYVGRVILGRSGHYHPYGMPPSFLEDASRYGIVEGEPSVEEVLPVRRERMRTVRELVDALTPEELDRDVVAVGPGYPPDGYRNKVVGCLWVVLEEEWQHHRFATRDLEVLESR